MLNCRQLVERSSDYLDNTLTRRARLGVRLHLAMCRHCRRFVAQLRLARRVLAARQPPEPDGADELATRLAQERRRVAQAPGTPPAEPPG